jgi:pectate lyase
MACRGRVVILSAALITMTCAEERGGDSTGARTPGDLAGAARGRPAAGGPIGWASVDASGQNGTTGGGAEEPEIATTESELWDAVAGDAPRVIHIAHSMQGSLDVGSNKTIEGEPGVIFRGHIEIDGSVNVIIRNLAIVGYNCADKSPCKRGDDAVTIMGSAHHVWIDHCSISDGSDGNLDVVDGSDYITISWTKFWYSGRRPGGHQFCNLIGSADGITSDADHFKITFHHDWWADNVDERMPRVRYGQVHLYNNLYTATGNHYCIGLGVDANLLIENNAFIGVRTPVEITHYSNEASVAVSRGNLYENTTGTPVADRGTAVFKPPYGYTLDPAATVRAAVMQGAGPK